MLAVADSEISTSFHPLSRNVKCVRCSRAASLLASMVRARNSGALEMKSKIDSSCRIHRGRSTRKHRPPARCASSASWVSSVVFPAPAGATAIKRRPVRMASQSWLRVEICSAYPSPVLWRPRSIRGIRFMWLDHLDEISRLAARTATTSSSSLASRAGSCIPK
jgi:hypothetical protein